MQNECPNCKKMISCTQDNNCWCMEIPKGISPLNGDKCLCSDCLIDNIAVGINNKSIPLNPTLRKEIIGLGKPAKIREGIDYYMEGPYLVMTTWYHLRKGYCCKNNCRHCAYK